MNSCSQTIQMLHFIKNPKGKPLQYLGMSGPNLIEILDNDPILVQALSTSTTRKLYKPSTKSRFTGKDQRMVLTGKNRQALFFLRISQSPKGYQGVELGILNLPEESFTNMVKELVSLAKMRWPKLPLFIRLNMHQDMANLKTALFNLGWIEDQTNSLMEITIEVKDA